MPPSQHPAFVASLSADDVDLYTEMAVIESAANWDRFERAAAPGLRIADVRTMARLAAHYSLDTDPAPSSSRSTDRASSSPAGTTTSSATTTNSRYST